MEDPNQSQEPIPKGNISQMDVDIGKQMELDAKKDKKKKPKVEKAPEKEEKIPFFKKIFKKKQTAGPMGVTDISKIAKKINISEDGKTFLKMVIESLIVGVLINIMVYNFGMTMSIINSLGWAVFFWMLKFKMPEIIKGYKK